MHRRGPRHHYARGRMVCALVLSTLVLSTLILSTLVLSTLVLSTLVLLVGQGLRRMYIQRLRYVHCTVLPRH
jgi:hypothetical protein